MYEFAGFFAKPQTKMAAVLPAGAVFRAINTPFVGVGIRLPKFIGGDELPDVCTVIAVKERLGLVTATDWLFIIYMCWGGSIDFVYGFGERGEKAFGPIKEFAGPNVQNAYIYLMADFGVEAVNAMEFGPFVRGFWGDV